MEIVGRFFLRLAAWAGGFLAVVGLAVALSGERDGTLVLHAVNWVAAALTFAAFPAGIAVADAVVRWDEPRLRPLLGLAAAAGLAGLLVIGVRGYAGPALARSVADLEPAGVAEAEPASLYLHERAAALRRALEAAADRAGAGAAAWRPANQLAWSLDGTIVGGLLAATLAGVGCLFGAWALRLGRAESRRAAYWALGLFLLVTSYLMTENSYEFIVVQMAGPAPFAAWLPLVGPGMLLVGLTIPTAAELLRPLGGSAR